MEYLFQKSSGKSYRPKTLTSNQFRVVFRRETLIGLGVAINPSIYRHIAIAISRRFLSKQHQFQQDEEGYSDPENESDYKDDIIDLQAGHKTKTSGIGYARGILERPEETFTKKNRYRGASIISQQYFFISYSFRYCIIYFYHI